MFVRVEQARYAINLRGYALRDKERQLCFLFQVDPPGCTLRFTKEVRYVPD